MDLDAILDEALDDFESRHVDERAREARQHALSGVMNKNDDQGDWDQSVGLSTVGSRTAGRRMDTLVDDDLGVTGGLDSMPSGSITREQLQEMMASMQTDPAYAEVLRNTAANLSQTEDGIATVDNLFHSLQNQFSSSSQQPGSTLYAPYNAVHVPHPTDPNGGEIPFGVTLGDREVAATMGMLGRAQEGLEGLDPASVEQTGERLMEDMMAQFEQLGEKEDYDEVIDGVMRQLLSKELMYEPTKQICEKFPEWLAIHRRNLSSAEYENYGNLYQCFQLILAVYETEPDNFPRLMELMYDMQQFGQPPAELIRDLAPGLAFDENGLPILPNMPAGLFPTMPGGGMGLPNLGELSENMGSGQCTIC